MMAQDAPQPAGTIAGQKLLIARGDGGANGGAEQFAEPVGLVTKTFGKTASTATTSVPDAANTDNPMWEQRGTKSLSAKLSGDGVCSKESFAIWDADVGVSRNYRVKLDEDGFGYWEGRFILTQFELSGTYGERIKVKVSLDSDGPLTYVPAP
jgi:predicted secreted protein